MAKPRIFVSSTFYDLKHIRNDLKRFIENYGFESVLNEFGSIPYDYSIPLDESCFYEAKLCNIFLLVIGGRYGSAVSGEASVEKIEAFYTKYTSITRKEYQTAYDNNIPIYIFIDKNVHSEYATYKKNKKNKKIVYAFVDSIGVYEFIEEIESKFINNNICTFEKFEDIERWLKGQWSGLFYKYLSELKERKSEEQILDSITKLDKLTENINNMMNEVGKKVFSNNGDVGHFEEVIQKGNQNLISGYTKRIVEYVEFLDYDFELRNDELEQVGGVLYTHFFDNDKILQILLKTLNDEELDLPEKKYMIKNGNQIYVLLDEIHPSLEISLRKMKEVVPFYLQEVKPLLLEDNLGVFKRYFFREIRVKFNKNKRRIRQDLVMEDFED